MEFEIKQYDYNENIREMNERLNKAVRVPLRFYFIFLYLPLFSESVYVRGKVSTDKMLTIQKR